MCAFQATAEQMRLAQVIFDKNDSEFEAKVKQVCFGKLYCYFGSRVFIVTSVVNDEVDICEKAH